MFEKKRARPSETQRPMSNLWLCADHVKCVHSSGELFSGYGTSKFCSISMLNRFIFEKLI